MHLLTTSYIYQTTSQIFWIIIDNAKSFSPGGEYCQLCAVEKTQIMKYEGDKRRNSNDELISICRHRRKYLLGRSKKSFYQCITNTKRFVPSDMPFKIFQRHTNNFLHLSQPSMCLLMMERVMARRRKGISMHDIWSKKLLLDI